MFDAMTKSGSAQSQYQLPNGLTVINLPVANNDMVGLALVIKTGRRDGTAAQAAKLDLLSGHFFRKTLTQSTSRELFSELERLNAGYEIQVDPEQTRVSMVARAKDAQRLLSLLGDLVIRPTFDAAAVENYKTLLIKSISEDDKTPAMWLAFHRDEKLFDADSPLARSGYLNVDAIKRFSPKQLEAAHRRLFNPQRAALVISGGSKLTSFQVQAALGPMRPGEAIPKRTRPHWRRGQPWSTHVRTPVDGEVPSVALAAAIPMPSANKNGVVDEQSVAAGVLLQEILSGGSTSRLFYNVSERNGLCYGISGHVWWLSDMRFLMIQTSFPPEDGRRAMQVAFAQLRDVAGSGSKAITGSEFAKARAHILAVQGEQLASAQGRSVMYATRWAREQELLTPAQMKRALDATSIDDVRRLARQMVTELEHTRLVLVAPAEMGRQLYEAATGPAPRGLNHD